MPDASPHSPHLAHHFHDLEQQHEASTLGMWLFLVTEILFFGGLFTAYIVYRGRNHEAFLLASSRLDVLLGTVNTAVLIGSSLTMAFAVRSAQIGKRKMMVAFLVATLLLGGAFLGVKAVEYSHKIHDHLVPGAAFEFEYEHARGAEIFFSLYFAMTGMHALHMIIGLGLLMMLAYRGWAGAYPATYYNPVENVGLYWHFVDIVWIFLFPLLYLLGRN